MSSPAPALARLPPHLKLLNSNSYWAGKPKKNEECPASLPLYFLTSLLQLRQVPPPLTTFHCHHHPFLIRPPLLLGSRLHAGAHHPFHPLPLPPLPPPLHPPRLSLPPPLLSLFHSS